MEAPGTRVTPRDRQLLAILAQARCLSDAQLKRLFWPRQSRQALQRRLLALSRGLHPVIKPLHWYTREGRRTAWALAPAGYLEAESELGEELDASREDVSPEYLEHHVLLSELFVGLLARAVESRAAATEGLLAAQRARVLASAYARARHPAFRWIVVGDRDLPWKQYEGPTVRERVIRPDAILDLPEARRRVFVESEVGTHTISAVSQWKPGSTMAKVDRYEAFCSGLADVQPRRTWYQARFPDGAAPEVLFLVRTPGRARSVGGALEEWRGRHHQAGCAFVVGTVEEAVTRYAGWANGVALEAADGWPHRDRRLARPDGRDGVHFTTAEFDALRRFFAATTADYKARRDLARTRRAPVPDYPAGTRELHAAIRRVAP